VLGVVMVKAFGLHLDRELAQFSLAPNVLQELHSNEIQLAGLQVPASMNPGMKIAIRESIGAAFIFGFRIVMLICGGLSAAGAAVAWIMIPKDRDLRGLAARL